MDRNSACAAFSAAIGRQAATVLVGAGLSFDAGYPTWTTLLEAFYEEFGVQSDAAPDLPLLAQHVVNKHGRGRLISHVTKRIANTPPAPTLNHHLMARLPIDEIWTTNYDTLIESADGSRAAVEVDDDFVSSAVGRRRVNKMHGSIRYGTETPEGGPDSIVITRDDYDRYPQLHPRAWQLLRAQFLTKSFMFLGFSMSDPNFNEVFKLVRLATPDRYMDHIALLRRGDTSEQQFNAAAVDLERVGVHVVEISDYAEITEFLQDLVIRTRPFRLYVSGSYPHTDGDGATLRADGTYPTPETPVERLDVVARMLGAELAATGIRVGSGSELCAQVGYTICDLSGGDYDPDRAWVLRRYKDAEVTPPSQRKGVLRFIGTDPREMRDAIFSEIRAIAVLGGGAGTHAEVDRARELGMGVVPLAVTGGTARQIWDGMIADLEAHTLGGAPINAELFAMLNSENTSEAVSASVALIRQALYLDVS